MTVQDLSGKAAAFAGAASRMTWVEPKDRLDYQENDIGNAQRLVGAFGPDLLFVVGKGWGVWDGSRYSFASGALKATRIGSRLRNVVEAEARAWFEVEIDPELVSRRLEAEIEKARPEFATPEGAISAIRKDNFARLMKHSVKCGNESKIKAALSLAQPMVMADIETLDAEPWGFICPNGVIDLRAARDADLSNLADADEGVAIRAGWLRPHRRESLPTRCGGVAYDPAAACPEWQALLELVLPSPEVRACFHRAMGMLLFGRNDAQVALLFRGGGGNGKSTVTAAIAAVLGESDGYTAACKIEMFIVTPQTGAGQATPEEVDIPGSRVMIASEPAATDELSAKKIKAMTGGDRRPARALGMPQFYYRPQAVPILSFNRTPKIRDEDEGTRRRLVFFPFDVNLRALPPEKRRNPSEVEAALKAERAGILNWMLDGWREYCRHGLAPTEEMQTLKSDVMERADPVGEFALDMTEPDAGGKISVGDAFVAYVEWCQRTGATEYKKTGFANIMQEKGYRKQKTDGGRWWYKGLKWKSTEGVAELLRAVNITPPPPPEPEEPAPF